MDKELTFGGSHLDGFIASLRGIPAARAPLPKNGALSELEALNKNHNPTKYRAQPRLFSIRRGLQPT